MANSSIGWPPGHMAARLRDKDWSNTPLGAIAQWLASLGIAVGCVLDSPLPMIVLWGPQLLQIYNDAYIPFLGDRHPDALGQPNSECSPDVWAFNEPIYKRVQDTGDGARSRVPRKRHQVAMFGIVLQAELNHLEMATMTSPPSFSDDVAINDCHGEPI